MADDPCIFLKTADENEIIEVYECYRLDAEPDSPQTPYVRLSKNERRAWKNGLQGMTRIIRLDEKSVGWLFMRPEKGENNIGFGLFPRYRNRGLMSALLPLLMQELVSESPRTRFSAAVRSQNTAAIRVLQKAGFCYAGSIVKFDVVYEKYEYPHSSAE